MSTPIVIDIPHSLGREEARRRIASGLDGLAARLPAGGTLRSDWVAEDRLDLSASVMGQTVPAQVAVGERVVSVSVVLPMMLGMMAGAVTAMVQKAGAKLLAPPAGGQG